MTHSSPRRRRRLALFLAALMVIAFLTPARSSAVTDGEVRQVAKGGFGDARNSYSWSMAWFKGKLYVGTARSQLCVEGATYDFYYPGEGYHAEPAPDLRCPADRYDLDLRAQIWQYTPGTDIWKMVYQAPADIPNPRAPGKFVSRDIGYRGMTVHTEPNGTPALYVGGITANQYIPEIAAAHPPRLLRTTDGENFAALSGPGYINDHAGQTRPMGFRALTPFRGRLYVTASSGLTGDGVVMEVRNPAGPRPRFVQVSPASMQVFEMEVFKDNLYLGAGSAEAGYSVWRTNLVGSPARFVPIVTGGAGRGAAIDSVVSMHPYRNRLYVGASGWNTLLPGSELIRISPDDRWELVVGNPRRSDGRLTWPASGLFDGFGNIFNAHFWRMNKDNGGLYLGTNDWSYAFRNFPPLDKLLRPGYGFDLYGSCDGTTWSAETTTAFGDGRYNFGLRTMASTKPGFFMGSTNHAQGTAVWLKQRAGTRTARLACAAGTPVTDPSEAWLDALEQALATAPPVIPTSGGVIVPPALPKAQLASCGTVVSWQQSPGATRYVVRRSKQQRVSGVALQPPPKLPNGFRLPSPPTAVPSAKTAAVNALGAYTKLGVTTGTTFVDRAAAPGEHYQYSVVAEKGSGSSRASLVGQTPLTDVTDVRETVTDLTEHRELSPTSARRINGLLTKVATASPAGGRKAAAVQALGAEVSKSDAEGAAAEDLGAAVYSLGRSVVSAPRGCAR